MRGRSGLVLSPESISRARAQGAAAVWALWLGERIVGSSTCSWRVRLVRVRVSWRLYPRCLQIPDTLMG